MTEPSATSEGLTVLESSPETRSQLGVQRWILDKNAPDGVEGYDAADQPLFKFAYRIDTVQRLYQYRVQGSSGLESMDISVGANDTPNVRSTIGDSAMAALLVQNRRMLSPREKVPSGGVRQPERSQRSGARQVSAARRRRTLPDRP